MAWVGLVAILVIGGIAAAHAGTDAAGVITLAVVVAELALIVRLLIMPLNKDAG